MENWRYAAINKNEYILNLKVNGYDHYTMKTNSMTDSKAPHIIIFKHDSLTAGTEAAIQVNNWKINLSFNPGNLLNAWDSIFPILAKYGMDFFSVLNLAAIEADIKSCDRIIRIFEIDQNKEENIHGETLRDYDNAKELKERLVRSAEGSQISIYPIPGLESHYRLALNEIEWELEGIRPGKFDNADHVFGIYTSVRYMPGKDMPASLLQSYNPDNVPEPFYPLEQLNFLHEVRKIARSTQIKNKRKMTKKFLLETFKQVYDILVLQDTYRFLKSSACDFLRKEKKKFRIIPFGKGETLALKAIVKALKKRLLEIAKKKKIVTSMEDKAIKEILGATKILQKPDDPKTLKKYLALQKKGVIKILGEKKTQTKPRYQMNPFNQV